MRTRNRLRIGSLAVVMVVAGALAAPPAWGGLFGGRSQRLQDGFEGGLSGVALPQDGFGRVVAVGDFDGNGYDDLAIGDHESATAEREGAVHVVYSFEHGLVPGVDILIQDFDPETGASDRELDDGFGEALAAGDFNADGFDDLAIGIPREHIGFLDDAGVVLILYGSADGLVVADVPNPRRFSRATDGIFLDPEEFDRFGSALAVGDFDADGYDDLAIGTPWSDAFTNQVPADSGAVQVLSGSFLGLTAFASRYYDQDSADPIDGAQMPNSCEFGDRFGRSLAVGDFDADGADDLAVGAPDEQIADQPGAGAVWVLYGQSGHGLRVSGANFWRDDTVDTGGDLAAGDGFGAVLAAGDVTGEGIDDLAIGAPFEDTAGFVDAGAVTLLWGQPGIGIDTPGSTFYNQNGLGDGETPAANEQFGAALAIGDFAFQHAEGRGDLAIGTPYEEVFDPLTQVTHLRAGAVHVVPGGFGLDAASSRFWFLGAWGSEGAADMREDSAYGYALAAGDFDGDGHDDLAIGAVEVEGEFIEDVESPASGALYVLYGALFADGFESGDRSRWTGDAV
jgi:hypothetical protein